VSIRIVIDAANIQSGGGLSHLVELLKSADPDRDRFTAIYVWAKSSTLNALPDPPWLMKCSHPFLERGLLYRLWWQLFCLGTLARRDRCHVLFIPGGYFYTDFRPIVTLSQNLLPFELPELFRYGLSLTTFRLLFLRFLQSASFRKSDGIIFLSHYSMGLVCGVSGLASQPIAIIPHGIGNFFFAKSSCGGISSISSNKNGLPQSCRLTLLYVSTVDVYKHQWNVVEAVSRIRCQTGLDIALDLVGPSYAPALRRLVKTMRTYDPHGLWARYRGLVDYSQLNLLYWSADIGIFASTCENLPITLLEMMASRIPIVCSNRGPMPEVLGSAGLYFDPEKPESLANALLTLILSKELCADLANKSYQLSLGYTWQECSRQTLRFLFDVSCRHHSLLEDQACAE
jgi:glycosyltransferase involved in cell wall biosynthesis